jgi:hypothetical protein
MLPGFDQFSSFDQFSWFGESANSLQQIEVLEARFT